MRLLFIKHEKIKAIIEQDEQVGFYLYIFDEIGTCIADHLQDSLEMAKEQAADEYDISQDSWKEE